MTLTPEERRKIYEEEKARIEIVAELTGRKLRVIEKQSAFGNLLIVFAVIAGIFGLLFAIVNLIGPNVDRSRSGSGAARSDTPPPPKFVIKVSGSEGLRFHGSYVIIGNGSSESKSVEGIVPDWLGADGSIVSASFQKKSKEGTLTLEIFKDGNVVKSAQTSAEYGVVSVSTR